MINPKTAMFGAISIFLYTSVYTPLKRSSLSVLWVLFRTIPFMLGWVAATGDFGIEAGTLFLIQFFGNSLIFGQLVGSCEDYERQVFLCCQQAKKTKVPLCRLFCIQDGYNHYCLP
jgi:protoheme IX farnesyltransferase